MLLEPLLRETTKELNNPVLITLMEMFLTHTKPTEMLPLTSLIQMTITHVHQKDKVFNPVKSQLPIMVVMLFMDTTQTHLDIVLMPTALMLTELLMPMDQTHLDIGTTTANLDTHTTASMKVVLRTFKRVTLTTPNKW